MFNDAAIIIQARTSSTRFPNKILKPFYNGRNCLELLVKRIQKKTDLPILIATSDSEKDNGIEELAKHLNVFYFRGDENNVLKRFIDCAEKFNVKTIIRICSDNPFLDMDALKELIGTKNENADYISYKINNTPSIKTHYGLWAEKVSCEALVKALQHTTEELYLEHVTNYIYAHDELFKIEWIIPPKKMVPDFPMRLTLDTEQDFNMLAKLYAQVAGETCDFNSDTVIKILAANNDFQNIMQEQIIKNSK